MREYNQFPDVLHEAVAMGNKISQAVVHESTIKYIAADFKKNGGKYAPADRDRVLGLLQLKDL